MTQQKFPEGRNRDGLAPIARSIEDDIVAGRVILRGRGAANGNPPGGVSARNRRQFFRAPSQ